jgi:hypothetical protein
MVHEYCGGGDPCLILGSGQLSLSGAKVNGPLCLGVHTWEEPVVKLLRRLRSRVISLQEIAVYLMAVGLLALASFVLVGLDYPRTAAPLYAVAIGMGLLPLAERRWLRAAGKTIPLVWPAMALSLSLSVVVAQMADRREPFGSYWPAFALWAVAVLLPLGAALQPLLPIPTEWPQLVLGWARSQAPELAVVAGITAVAATVRFINLTSMPWPFGGDEAAHAEQAMRVAKGEISNMFQSGLQGQTNLY